MKRIFRVLLGVLVPLLVWGNLDAAADSFSPGTEQVEEGPVSVRLVSEKEGVAPGEPFWVALEFNMDKGWHTYWKNPGEVGFAPEVKWTLPKGFEVSELHWPYPERLEENAMVSFGYQDTMVLLAQIVAPKKLMDPQHVDIIANVRWVACKDSCMPGNAEPRLTLPVIQGPAATSPQMQKLFDEARSKVPAPTGVVEMAEEGGELVLKMSASEWSGDFSEGYFFPEKEGLVDYAALPKLTRLPEQWSLSLPFQGKLADTAASLKGVLVLKDHNHKTVAVEIGGGAHTAGHGLINTQLLIAILCALGGGLILNLMPCVLPVISLKVMSFVNLAGSNRKTLLKHGGAFTMGVLASFWVLAALLLVLRASGQVMGWGFQLQEPIFVGALVMILFLLSLSLLGVFEVGTSLSALGGGSSHKRKGLTASFLSGVLATLVATPCTGPLLAPALGFAMTLSAGGAVAVFTAMGLGMASPYLLLSAFPKLMKRMPKPGPWMVIFKQVMGFMMLATVLWLMWVFQAQMASPIGIMALLAALLVLGLGAWVYGRWGTQMVKKTKRYIAYGATAALVAVGFTMGLLPVKADPGAGALVQVHEDGDWIPFDAQKLAELRKQGIPVFVDFTAKWCLTCQTNKMATHSHEAKKHFDQRGVVRMVADWTNGDAEITKELAKFNRNSVPLYVIYKGEADDPIILPQLLGTGTVIEALKHLETVEHSQSTSPAPPSVPRQSSRRKPPLQQPQSLPE